MGIFEDIQNLFYSLHAKKLQRKLPKYLTVNGNGYFTVSKLRYLLLITIL